MKTLIAYHTQMDIYAVSLMLIALILLYLVGKRRFNRRGIAGTQYFSSYNKALTKTFFECLLRFIAVLMLLGAIVIWLMK